METVTLQSKDFSTVHNTLCELRSVQERLTGVISNELADRLQKIVAGFEAGLADAYRQDNEGFDKKMAHFDDVRENLGLSSIWSIYEVEDMSNIHPFEDAIEVAYADHWGGKTVSAKINGPTWEDLYVAANECIRNSGDGHHIYIEQFRPSSITSKVLFLSTGS